MAVRCKFKLWSRTSTMQGVWNPETHKSESREVQSFNFQVVTNGSDEDQAFFASTPTGRIELGVCNPDAVKELELNKEYYVTFTPAE